MVGMTGVLAGDLSVFDIAVVFMIVI